MSLQSPTFYTPLTAYFNDVSGGAASVSVPWVDSFSSLPSGAQICVIKASTPQLASGLYLQVSGLDSNGVPTTGWKYILSFIDLCAVTVGGQGLRLYQNLSSTQTFATGSLLWLNAQTQSSLSATASTGVWVVAVATAAQAGSGVTIGSTSIAGGGSTMTLAGLTSVSSTSFVGALSGNASTATKFVSPQVITFSGDATGTATFDGSTGVTSGLTLASTAVTPGSYTNANLTVDAKGRITAVANGSAGGGGVTTFNTRSGAVTLSSADVTSALGFTPYSAANPNGYTNSTGTVTSVGLTSTDFSVSGSPITSSGSITANLTTTAVTPGAYTNANITVDSKGRITAAANGTTSGTGTVTTVSVVTANGVSGSVANPTTTPALTFTLGAITPTSVAATGSVSGSNLSGTNTGDQTITLTGDVTGSGTGSFATALATTAVTAGSYTNANITVDAKGRLTAAANGSASSGGPINLLQRGIPMILPGSMIFGANGAVTFGLYPGGNLLTLDNTGAGGLTGRSITLGTATLAGTSADNGKVITLDNGKTFTITTFGTTTTATGTLSAIASGTTFYQWFLSGQASGGQLGTNTATFDATGSGGLTGRTLTASVATFTSTAVDVGRVVVLDGGKTFTITAFTSTTVVVGTLSAILSTTTFAAGTWIYGYPIVWSFLSSGYPQGFVYYPANSWSSSNTAGWYWTVFATTMTGTVYNIAYTPGNQATAVVPTGGALSAGAISGAAGTANINAANVDYVMDSQSITGGTIGRNGRIQVNNWLRNNPSTINKNMKSKFGVANVTAYYSVLQSSNTILTTQASCVFLGSTTRHTWLADNQSSTAATQITGSYDNASTQVFVQSLAMSLQTDWACCDFTQATIWPSL